MLSIYAAKEQNPALSVNPIFIKNIDVGGLHQYKKDVVKSLQRQISLAELAVPLLKVDKLFNELEYLLDANLSLEFKQQEMERAWREFRSFFDK